MVLRRISPRYSNRSALIPSRSWNATYNIANEFERIFSGSFAPFKRSLESFSPSINVSESEANLEVTAELPGLTEDEINLSVGKNEITISGEKKQAWEEQEGYVYRAERTYGSFSRTVRVPTNKYDLAMADAVFKNGVLTLTIPKLEIEPQVSKRIEVKTG